MGKLGKAHFGTIGWPLTDWSKWDSSSGTVELGFVADRSASGLLWGFCCKRAGPEIGVGYKMGEKGWVSWVRLMLEPLFGHLLIDPRGIHCP